MGLKDSRFAGAFVATLTPFDGSGTLDRGAMRSHAEWLAEGGAAGLCPVGTTGEFLYLSDAEKRAAVAATVAGAAGRVPVIAGIWALHEAEMRDLARAAADSGADAVFLPPPIYYPASDEAVFRWYSAAHTASPLPVFAYNIPQYAVSEVSFAALERCLTEGVVVGAKDSTGSSERVGELVRRFGGQYSVFAASDSFASEGRRLGADGFISAIANVMPETFRALWAGDESQQAQVDKFRAVLKRVGSIPGLKHLLTRLGFPFGDSRIPYTTLSAANIAVLDQLEL